MWIRFVVINGGLSAAAIGVVVDVISGGVICVSINVAAIRTTTWIANVAMWTTDVAMRHVVAAVVIAVVVATSSTVVAIDVIVMWTIVR